MESSVDFRTLSLRILLFCAFCFCKSSSDQPVYHNQFAVHMPDVGSDIVNGIASKHGFTNLGQIGDLKGYYLLEHSRVHKRSLNYNEEHHNKLKQEPEVRWVQQQFEKKRTKRDFSLLNDKNRKKRQPAEGPHKKRDFDLSYPDFGTFLTSPSQVRTRNLHSPTSFPDPLFKEEWYLNGGAKDGFDMNVGPAWSKGYTGKGVVVSILDDGIQTNHPDLAANYDPLASTDINDNDSDPMPRDNGDNKHGTRCAGEVAAVAFNGFCGVGVAYNSSIGGVRMLDGSVNDAVEARALSLNPDHVDIYSASWGPEDDGKTVDGPGPLARRAFINGVTTGRKGKGSIFVWASGNGGRHTDSCNCDGYTNSIFTLSISSATQGGYKPWYLEECSSTLASTYSSGTPGHDKSIATVDMDGKLRPDHICTVEHTGTSASAPLAAGLCALALEANPDLTWRDMQHIVVMTSNPSPLMKESGWVTNGVQRKVSHKFGYGLMDGGAMVNLAEQWTTVPAQHICKSEEIIEDRSIDPSFGSVLTVHSDATGCQGTVNEVRYVEHVQCKISLRFFPRGNLRLVLTSPLGTPSTLLLERPRDVVASNFDDWPFLSVHYWGEDPRGKWTLQVYNAGNRHVNQPGILRKWQLIFYGTSIEPVRLRNRSSFTYPSASILNSASLEQQRNYPSFFATPSTLGIGQATDIFSQTFRNIPNIFSASGSEKKLSYAEMDIEKSNNSPVEEQNELSETKCHESCSTCAGPSQDNCLTCAPQYFYVSDLGLCMQSCPDGYYEDRDSRSCIICGDNCASCPNGPDTCNSCDSHLILHNSTCIVACPQGNYETDDYRCSECPVECESCKKGNQCITCKPDGRLASSNGYCHPGPCPDNCIECSAPNQCTMCSIGYELSSNGLYCVLSTTQCRPGEMMSEFGCQPCTDITKCVKCPLGLYLMNNSCLTACDPGYFSDAGLCRRCKSDGCLSCLSDDQCLLCQDSLKLFSGTCVSHCPKNTHPRDKVCQKCHHFCSSCTDEGPYSCTTCAPDRYLDAATKLCLRCKQCKSTGHQCCQCDKKSGLCHISNGSKRRIAGYPPLTLLSLDPAAAAADLLAEASSQNIVVLPSLPNQQNKEQQSSSNYNGLVGILVASTLVIIVVLVVLGSRRSKNWEYSKVPMFETNYSYLDLSHLVNGRSNECTGSLRSYTVISENLEEISDNDENLKT